MNNQGGMRFWTIATAILLAVACNAGRGGAIDLALDDLALLTRAGCANTATMRGNVDGALRSMGLVSNYRVVDLDTVDKADARRGYPTPTLLYANRDVFGMAPPQPPFPDPT